MRWKYPRRGDERTRKFFALLPKRGTDGYVYWLCRVTKTERYYSDAWMAYWERTHLGPADEAK